MNNLSNSQKGINSEKISDIVSGLAQPIVSLKERILIPNSFNNFIFIFLIFNIKFYLITVISLLSTSKYVFIF